VVLKLFQQNQLKLKHNSQSQMKFSLCNATHRIHYTVTSSCLSVCLSVTCQYCIRTFICIIKVLSLPGSHIIVIFLQLNLAKKIRTGSCPTHALHTGMV